MRELLVAGVNDTVPGHGIVPSGMVIPGRASRSSLWFKPRGYRVCGEVQCEESFTWCRGWGIGPGQGWWVTAFHPVWVKVFHQGLWRIALPAVCLEGEHSWQLWDATGWIVTLPVAVHWKLLNWGKVLFPEIGTVWRIKHASADFSLGWWTWGRLTVTHEWPSGEWIPVIQVFLSL